MEIVFARLSAGIAQRSKRRRGLRRFAEFAQGTFRHAGQIADWVFAGLLGIWYRWLSRNVCAVVDVAGTERKYF